MLSHRNAGFTYWCKTNEQRNMCYNNEDYIRFAARYKYGVCSIEQTAYEWCDFLEKYQSLYGIFGECYLVFSPWENSIVEQKVSELQNRHKHLVYQFRASLTDIGAINHLHIGQRNGGRLEVVDGIMICKMY